MVPSRHTMMNIHRKMRSITMATYFQSSFTWMEITATKKDTRRNFELNENEKCLGLPLLHNL